MHPFHYRNRNGILAVKLVGEYLEEDVKFARMAAQATDPKLSDSLWKQAFEYRKLAKKRAAELKLPPVNLPALWPGTPSDPS